MARDDAKRLPKKIGPPGYQAKVKVLYEESDVGGLGSGV
jgi:hypothetical protein